MTMPFKKRLHLMSSVIVINQMMSPSLSPIYFFFNQCKKIIKLKIECFEILVNCIIRNELTQVIKYYIRLNHKNRTLNAEISSKFFSFWVMSGETVPILINTSSSDGETHGALSVVCSDGEDVPLVPEVVFDSTLDSPGFNRESQPLLGGLDVSYNQFPGQNYYKSFIDIFINTFLS